MKFKLIRRKQNVEITLPLEMVKSAVSSEEGKKLLLDNLQKFADTTESYVHDKVWLEMIANWVPEHGTPVVELIRWLRIAEKVANLSSTEDHEIELSVKQVSTIWDRIKSKEFRLTRTSQQFWKFLQDFMAVAELKFSEDDDEV